MLARIVLCVRADLAGLVVLSLRSRRAVAAENLFLRRQLALYQERGAKPRRVDAATRVSLAVLSRLFDRRDARRRPEAREGRAVLRTTVIGARALAVFLAAVVAIMAGAGGAMAATSTPVPASFTLPEDSRRFDGSVAVNVTIDVPRLRLVRPKQIMSLNDLSARFGVPDEAMAAMLGGDALVFPAGRSRTFHAESNGFSAASQQAADQAADRTSRSA